MRLSVTLIRILYSIYQLSANLRGWIISMVTIDRTGGSVTRDAQSSNCRLFIYAWCCTQGGVASYLIYDVDDKVGHVTYVLVLWYPQIHHY